MAVVSSLTKERMIQIENSCIVSGAVLLDGHLQLTRKDGGTIDAGPINAAPAPSIYTGTMLPWPGTELTIPTGFLICRGGVYNTADFPQLFALIGYRYSSWSSGSTFAVPNMVDTVPIAPSSDSALGTSVGSNTAQLANNNMPLHNHTINHAHADGTAQSAGAHVHALDMTSTGNAGNYVPRGGTSGNITNTNNAAVNSSGAHTHSVTIPTFSGSSGMAGGGSGGSSANPFSIMQKSVYINWMIKT